MTGLIFRFQAVRTLQAFRTLTVVMTVLLASVFLSVGDAFGQATSAGTVVGVASDSQGAVVAGATVTLTDVTLKTSRTVPSNDAGQYVFVNVPPGTYSLSVSMPGFSTTKIEGLVVSVGTQTTANAKLNIGQTATTVEVQASNTDLQTMNASTGTTVDPAMVESLPAIGRDVATFATMQPGVTPGGNVAGTTVDQATFQLDGGSNTADMDGTQGVYTTSNVNSSIGGFFGGATGAGGVVPMPQDSVEEFKVSTTGQTADFNNSSGSQSQVVTKRGRDAVHGTVYEYYLDSNIGANTWQNNFPNAYTPKPSYHFNRFGAAAGGPIAPKIWGGRTYLFANYEGFRYPLAATYERAVPSYEFLQQGQLTFGTNTYSAAQLLAADPRHIGVNQTLANVYKTQLPQAPVGDNGPASGLVGTFDKSCGALSGSVCDSVNIIGYKANILTPQSSNFLATRMDHDFGPKWHLMMSYRYYSFTNLTSNQADIGGVLPGDTLGVPKALTPRPQQPWYFVVGVTTNISSSLTNDFHYSYLRNFWQWKGANAPAQVAGAAGAIEPLGESSTIVLSPYNVNAQNIRTRIWNGKDNFFTDNLTKLKGDHLIQFGGQFQHNWNYHQRTDNGASINFTPTYQIGGDSTGGNISYSSSGIGGLATTGNYRRIADTYYGLVTATQVANTYTNSGGNLSLNAPLTPIGAHTTIPYYNIYATDTWHAKPSLTLNYGISYAIEMPPSERDGNQVMFTDASGNAIHVQDYLNNRQAAALSGQVYNPEIGFALLKNVAGGRKYPYDPYYAAFSPRVSVAWNPKFGNDFLSKLFGDGATVIRGGYGRIYGRINGDVQVLNPLLSPGLILATQCKYAQNTASSAASPTPGSGTCTQTNFNETTAYRFGTDGLAPTLTNAALPLKLAQPYHPGFDGPGVSIASPVDPSVRPNDVDTFNLSIQRQINRKMLVEVGYIGRLVHHEYIQLNPNSIPYMMSVGGQSFASAYLAIETAFGCATSASLCSTTAAKAGTKSTSVNPSVAPQPFFEQGLNPAYCAGYSSCTAAVVAKQASNFGSQNVFTIWQALDNNTNGAGGTGFNFPRSLMGTPTSSATYGGAGQVVTGLSMGTANGYSNYHGGYVSFKSSDFHGLTFQENLTLSKALGLNAYNQSTSSIAAVDNFNLREQYGRQSFDQKVIFNTFIVYQIPYYREQNGIVGRLAGGWTLAPVLTAGTGQPLQCVTNNNGQNFGGEDGSTFTDSNENCVFTSPYSGGRPQTHRNVAGSTDSLGVAVGTTPKGNVNFFSNPAAVFDTVRPLLLGLDNRSGGGGRISGLGYLNLDLSVKKRLVVYEKVSMEFSGVISNVMNHLDFSNPSMSLQSVSNWGTTKTQGNNPRQIQMGVRASF
jgi:Carboxypeptidase regulatory-like domain